MHNYTTQIYLKHVYKLRRTLQEELDADYFNKTIIGHQYHINTLNEHIEQLLTNNMSVTTQQFLNFYNQPNIPLVEDGIMGAKSQEQSLLVIDKIKNTFAVKNYYYNQRGINILALRLGNEYTDVASDWFIVTNGDKIVAVPCSTKAGRYYVYNPISYGGLTGTAVLVEGQYKQTWQFITSSNWQTLWLQTPYFNQIQPVKIYRDGNKDHTVDTDSPTQTGLFGINIHTAGWNYAIWNWSAGCIVIPRQFWLELLPLFTQGQIYDFTLLHQKDIA